VGSPSQTTVLAFTASMLSVTAFLLSYYIERQAADMEVLEYHLHFECPKGRQQSTGSTGSQALSMRSMRSVSTLSNMSALESMSTQTGMTREEKINFLKRKGLKRRLALGIAGAYKMSDRNLELGYIRVTRYGIIAHIVYYVDTSYALKPKEWIDDKFQADEHALNEVFREHFGVGFDFTVSQKKHNAFYEQPRQSYLMGFRSSRRLDVRLAQTIEDDQKDHHEEETVDRTPDRAVSLTNEVELMTMQRRSTDFDHEDRKSEMDGEDNNEDGNERELKTMLSHRTLTLISTVPEKTEPEEDDEQLEDVLQEVLVDDVVDKGQEEGPAVTNTGGSDFTD